MTWTEPKPPTKDVSSYDHTTCETPLGKMIIEWKSWKEKPDYDLTLEDKWICCVYDLDECKKTAVQYLNTIKYLLETFLTK